jgi:hypothetical protein
MVIRDHLGYAAFSLFTFLILSSTLLSAQNQPAEIAPATLALLQGRVDAAVILLKAAIASEPNNSRAHQLLCRAYYAEDLSDIAIHECELAASASGADSETEMWLGRAYGLKAAHTSPFTALSLAKKVRQAFENAVDLNPDNVHACSDLGEFYVGAPGFVGGGLDKAEALATRMQSRFPSQAHRLLALIAGKRKDPAAQETEFKQAINFGGSAASYIDLASFYQQRDNPDLALSTVRTAVRVDRAKGPSLVDAASILTSAHREPEFAERLLREYLTSPGKTDEAPAFKVYLQLGDLLVHDGNATAAHAEYAAAVALASTYSPALKALQTH